MKKLLAIVVAAAMLVSMTALFASCGSSDTTSSSSDTSSAAAADDAKDAEADAADAEDAGFTELPIFEDEELGFMNVSAVYFQPVPLSADSSGKEQKAEDYDIHLEADIAALENKLGYELGSWVPYLTVDYKVTDPAKDDTVLAEGTFMEMAASDGPHYGSNIKLPDAGTYDLTITIHSPAENDYLIHTDDLTGPGGTLDEYFKDGPLSVTKSWDYAGPVTVDA
ncbi:MAG: iron transporter [Ruminococcus sp.]|nr:iron transporter [Ruminococcus sp.]